MCEGVIWIPEEAIVRASSDGFIREVVAKHGQKVARGDPLFVCEDPFSRARVKILEAEIRQMEAEHKKAWVHDRVQAALIEERLNHKQKAMDRERERTAALTIRSPTDGAFIVVQPEDLPGRFTRQGATIAQVLELGTLRARAIVPQDSIDLVRGGRLKSVGVRLAETIGTVTSATVGRIVPGASEELPSSALGTAGGGEVPTDPLDPQGVRAMAKLFQIELDLAETPGYVNVGGRVFIRFHHGWEPLAQRWYRSLRRLFLSRFNV
jgi:putative peptide zinc metalloprotease protein